MDADVGILHAIDRDCGWNVDIGVVEVGEFCFPVGVLEFEEQRTQDSRLVERGIGHRLHVVRRQRWPRSGRFGVSTEATRPARSTSGRTAKGTEATAATIGLEELTRGSAFFLIQTNVSILVELLDDLAFFPHWTARPTRSASAAASKRWLREREALPREIGPLFPLSIVQHG